MIDAVTKYGFDPSGVSDNANAFVAMQIGSKNGGAKEGAGRRCNWLGLGGCTTVNAQ
jgi:hypothetical protein